MRFHTSCSQGRQHPTSNLGIIFKSQAVGGTTASCVLPDAAERIPGLYNYSLTNVLQPEHAISCIGYSFTIEKTPNLLEQAILKGQLS